MKKESLKVESLVVDVRTAAKLLNVCEKTIRNLTKRGELPVVRIASGVRYSREDLAEFVRQRSRQNPNIGGDRVDSALSPK